MDRFLRRAAQFFLDIGVLSTALALAFLIRFDWHLPVNIVKRLFFLLPYVVFLQYTVMFILGVHRFAWRYIGLHEVTRIFQAFFVANSILLFVRWLSAALLPLSPYAEYALIPIGVNLMDFALVTMGIVGVRVIRRLWSEQSESQSHRNRNIVAVPTLLIGAGQAGVLVAKEVESRPDLGITPVGFVDDDSIKKGSVIHGIKVLGTTQELAAISKRTGAEQALITFANAPPHAIRQVVKLCENAGISVKIVPGLYEIVSGKINLSRIRNVQIEDLLRREPVKLDEIAIKQFVRDKTVLVTGAGGSIGSELCRQIMRFSPKTLVMVEQAENNLFQIHRELLELHPTASALPCIGNICDPTRMEILFNLHQPQVVFHAAAHKHVPMMEWNPGEAIKNNVLGTRVVADLAERFHVEHFVMISTDKAVNPSSVMGATKRVAEAYIQALSERATTKFVAVRFGNVLGSAGSVIPIFKEQIAKGGPITVTHPDMQRYFMTIPEACQLVLQAATMGKGGEIFILNMGNPVKIVDLANDLITLSGLRPNEDIAIQFTGVRPGEKFVEELSQLDEAIRPTSNPDILVGKSDPTTLSVVVKSLSHLQACADSMTSEELCANLQTVLHSLRLPVAPKTNISDPMRLETRVEYQ